MFLNCLDTLKEVTQRNHQQFHLHYYKVKTLYCSSLKALLALHQNLLKKQIGLQLLIRIPMY